MAYNFKSSKVIINGVEQIIVPSALPESPADGHYAIDSTDGKLKTWNQTELRWIVLGDAIDQVFDNESNGFAATTVQAAIEESKTVSLNKSRFTIICTFNSTIGNNNWLGFNEVLPGNQTPIRHGIKCRLREIAFSYSRSNILGIPLSSENVDGQFQLYKNGLTSPGDVVHTETFTNQPGGKIVNGLSIDFNAGDFMVGKWLDSGDNPSDMAIIYYLEVRE